MITDTFIVPLVVGFVLDCLLGDPRWLPHPIRGYGWLIDSGERLLNRGEYRRLKGGMMSLGLLVLVFGFFSFLFSVLRLNVYTFNVVAACFVFYGLANRSLIKEAFEVIQVLNELGLEASRKRLSWIVGRDTSELNEQQIRIAVLETLAENLSDGVVAPLFYYCLGGVPAMLTYKMANTLDSMIGYKNERFANFGYVAAKVDDILNFIPARLTAVLMAFMSLSGRAFLFILKYGRAHSSPNAGYPEAALAGILNCQFGGPNRYHGKLVRKPYIGEHERFVTDKDVYRTALLNFAIALFMVVSAVFVSWYFKY